MGSFVFIRRSIYTVRGARSMTLEVRLKRRYIGEFSDRKYAPAHVNTLHWRELGIECGRA